MHYSPPHNNASVVVVCLDVRIGSLSQSLKETMLYISELAALIGHHQYQTPGETKLNIWKRLSPQTYNAALARTNATFVTPLQQVRALGLNLTNSIAATDETCATNSVQDTLQQPLLTQLPPAIQQAQAILDNPTDSASVKARALQRIVDRPELHLSAKAQDTLHAAATTLAQQKETISKDAICDFLTCVKLNDSSTIAAAVHTVVNTSRGTRNEPKGVAHYEQMTGVSVSHRNDKLYTQNVGTSDAPCWICGRVDGLTDTKVIEVKCRRNRLFQWLPKYERVQIMAYMAVTDRPKCDLVQKWNGQVQIETYAFDAVYWATVCAAIRDAHTQLRMLFQSSVEQDELIRSLSK